MYYRPRLSLLKMRVRSLKDRASESLLPIPVLIVFLAVGLEVLLVSLDRRIDPATLPEVLRLSPEASISLLSTIAGATITTAGVVFSLIVVSLQLASGQFSPRVMRGFFREPLGKVLMGLLAALFTYCVLALKAMRSGVGGAPYDVPVLTVDAALLLTLMCVAVLVGYLHRVAMRQYVGHILADIAEESIACHEAIVRPARGLRSEPMPDVTPLGRPFVVPAPRSGWLQQVSGAGLLAAVPPGSVVRLETRVGAFLLRDAPLASVWPIPAHPQRVRRALQAAAVLGDVRTMQEDLDFGLRQLVDIALRALSPAVNDPTTAVEAMLRMGTILRPLLLQNLPPQVRRAPNGTLLLRPWDLDHADYVRHAIEELRIVAAPSARVSVVLVRCVRSMLDTLEGLEREDVEQELDRQLTLTLQGCERAGLLPDDLQMLHDAARRIQDPRRLTVDEALPAHH